jgi:protein SCO1/2
MTLKKYKQMKNIPVLVLMSFLFVTAPVFSQIDQSEEVQVIEHLGDTIPLDLKFVTDEMDTVTLGKLIDKPTILSFVYFDCPGLCSPLLEGVGDVIRKSDMVLGKDYQVITISFNFRDTPEKAKQKKKQFTERYSKDNGEGWIFLTTDSTTIYDITHATGFITKAVGFDFIHPSAIIAVSPQGKITRYLYGITFLPMDVKLAIAEANEGKARPTIQKIMLMCYSYDPENQRFGLDVTKIIGTVIAFFLLLFVIFYLVRRKK